MKMTTLLATVMGLALVFGTATNSEAWCLFGCADVDNSADRFNSDDVGNDKIGGDQIVDMGKFAIDSVVTNNQTVTGGSATAGNIGNVSGTVNVSANATAAGVDKSHDNNIQILTNSSLTQ